LGIGIVQIATFPAITSAATIINMPRLRSRRLAISHPPPPAKAKTAIMATLRAKSVMTDA